MGDNKFFALVEITKESDYCFFRVESNHDWLFLYRLFVGFGNAFRKGFREGCKITMRGNIPSTCLGKKDFINRVDIEFLEREDYESLLKSKSEDCKL